VIPFFKYKSILLIGILFLQADGILLLLKMQQCYIQYHAKERLADKSKTLEELTLSLSAYNHAKAGLHELVLNEEMYDVKSVTFDDDCVTLVVLHDHDEENIIRKIRNFLCGEKQSGQNLPVQVQQLLSMKYLPPDRTFFKLIPVKNSFTFSFIEMALPASVPDIPSPPPKYT
jgi:hypothetical protein